MPKTSPLRGQLLSRLPVKFLNSVFPPLRLLSQVLHLVAFALLAPLRLLRAALGLAPPAASPIARGHVTHVGASWAGLPKTGRRAAFVSPLGLLGDRQRSDWIAGFGGHGGLDKAVCIFDAAILERLAREGHPMSPGACGENFALAGLPWATCAKPGARIALGRHVIIEISEVTSPCGSTKGGFLRGDNSLIDERKHPGCSRWYARVLRSGWVAVGDEALLLRMPAA